MLKFSGFSCLTWDPSFCRKNYEDLLLILYFYKYIHHKWTICTTPMCLPHCLNIYWRQQEAVENGCSFKYVILTCAFRQSWLSTLPQSYLLESLRKRSNLVNNVYRHSGKHSPRKNPGAQCALKIFMIHEVLQFALRIAFRCVLHRCGSLDIRCWKLYCNVIYW